MEEAGAAIVIPDEELDGPRLAREVGALLGSPQRTTAMARAARAVARPDAAERVADELLRAAGLGSAHDG
jgi:UDP-N-acetylglucosamine--N-acetylmuramyl-(pentapeptide) pyrophosphoryl-undecaprenol N-acetylglucosamine transferase